MVERVISETELKEYAALVTEMTAIIQARVGENPTHQVEGVIGPNARYFARYLMMLHPLTNEASFTLFTNDLPFEEDKSYILRNPTIKEGFVQESFSYRCDSVYFGKPTPEGIENLGDDEYWEDALIVGIDELRMVAQIVRNPSEGFSLLTLLPKLRDQVW